jgi:hypothetical protein
MPLSRGWGRRGFGKPEPAIPILGQTSVTKNGTTLGIKIEIQSDELNLAIGPESLCDVVTRALTKHHEEAIASGRRPSGGSQSPLDPQGEQGRRAKAGKRPSARGNTGKDSALPPNLSREPIKATGRIVTIGSPPKDVKIGPRRPARVGTQAHASIIPGRAGQAKFIDESADEGIEFFAVDGAADRVIEDAVIDYMATVFDGIRTFSPEQVKARDIK